jgi:hypothetical protein
VGVSRRCIPSRPHRKQAAALAAAAALILSLAGLSVAAPVAHASTPSASAAPRQAKQLTNALPVRTVRTVPAGDEIVNGRGDPEGWHLYAASSGGGWAWQPLATLAPAGLNANGERWTGRQCLTGDGRYVVAVVAGWSADNASAGADRGGVAYVIDAHTGAVRPLVSGVSLYYFSPSCGPGSTVALTRYIGSDEQSTQLVLADAVGASVRTVTRLHGQYTGAVPAAGSGFLAVSGDSVVAVSATGRRTVRARVAGQPFDLVANAAGGADYLVGTGRSAASVWHLDGKGARKVGDGVFDRLALYEGRDGHTVAAGTTRLAAMAGIVALTRQTALTEAASLDGTAYSPVPAQSARPAAARRSVAATGALPSTPLLLDSQGRTMSWMPTAAAPRSAMLPPVLNDGDASAAFASRAAARTASTTAATATTCAVARNDVYLQAMQPSPGDVDWAANLAGRGLLTGNAARPSGYANLNLPSYSPSSDFPLPAPFGAGAASIPREVLEAIFAQESNFNQASWHSVQGVAGNPMIADYYGAAGGYVAGVATPDCGYGLGQVTTGMHTGEMSYDLQRKIAVDYAENAAASAQLLAQKWNQLAAAGITANNADPSVIENWYMAIWAYNSGLHANTGSGPWGLGWANNPANPDYPYNRHPFLHEVIGGVIGKITYEDAATPGNWPYQEKVFGWMEVPIESSLTGNASYEGTIETFDQSSNTNVIRTDAYELTRPGNTAFCTLTGNQCDPTVCSLSTYGGNCDPAASDGTGPCTRADYECWWHSPVSWCTLLTPCHSGTWEYNAGDSEPAAPSGDYYPLPACSVSTTDIPAGTQIVDSQANTVNLQGCEYSNENWANSGSFAFTYGDPAVPASQQTDMDVHQLGTGLGGHMWFTHTDEPTDANGVSLWGVTGTWTPRIAKGRYQVKVFIPAAGASAIQANYTIANGAGLIWTVPVNQNSYTDQWVSLGYYWLGPGAYVSLTNLHVLTSGDLAFSGMAFVPQSTGSYAMLGDSYSAGEGAGSYDANTSNYATTCGGTSCTNNGHRSHYSYNRVFASNTATFANPATWVDVACSGAVIADYSLSNSAGKCPNEPGQKTALSASTSLITLTFGGNDLDFAPIITDCIKAVVPGLNAPSCQSVWSATFQAQIQQLGAPNTAGGLPLLFSEIKAAAPNAEVVVLGYPHLVIPGNSTGNCLAGGYISSSDREWLNSAADQIDTVIQGAADTAGVAYLSTNALFTGHELCSTAPWFTGIGDPTTNDTSTGLWNFIQNDTGTDRQQWFHPNVTGYAQEASLLAGALQVP